MKDQKGQAIVETAIILPLLILLIMGLFEFGRFLYLKNTINNAARAGARAAAVSPTFSATHPDGMAATGVTHTLSCTNAEYGASDGAVYRSICNSLFAGIPKSQVVVDIAYTELAAPIGLSNGDNVTITVTWDKFEAVLPVLIPITNLIRGEASMRYENE